MQASLRCYCSIAFSREENQRVIYDFVIWSDDVCKGKSRSSLLL